MADWKRLREERAAEEAERIAASSGGDYGATGDFGDASEPVDPSLGFSNFSHLPKSTISTMARGGPVPFVPDDPQEKAAQSWRFLNKEASQQQADLPENRSAISLGAEAAGKGMMGAFGHAGDVLAATPIGMAGLYGTQKVLGGREDTGTFGDEASAFRTALKPFSNVGKGAAELFGYKTDGGIDERDTLQGQQVEKLGENFQAATDPEAPWQERVASGAVGLLRLPALLSGGSRGMSTIPFTNLAPLPDAASLAMKGASKVARAAEGVGIANPTMTQLASGIGRTAQELLGVARATPPGGNLFEEAVRRGAVNMPGKPQLTKQQSDKITAVATQLATVNGKLNPEKLSDYWTAGALRAREIDTLDETALANVMRDFSMKEARANRTGVPLKEEMVAARESIPIDEADSLGLSDEATKEILSGGPMEAESPAKVRSETYAPRGESAEAAMARLSRVEKAIAEGGDVEQVMQDAAMLPREHVFDLALELGGNAQRNKQKGLDIIREALEQRAKEPTRPPTSAAGRQEAAELELAEQAEAIADGKPVAPPPQTAMEPSGLGASNGEAGGQIPAQGAAEAQAGRPGNQGPTAAAAGQPIEPQPGLGSGQQVTPLGAEPTPAAPAPAGVSTTPPRSTAPTPPAPIRPGQRPPKGPPADNPPSPPPKREPRPATDYSREGLSYPKLSSTVREDFAGWYANKPGAERANEFANRMGAIEHRGHNNASRLMPKLAEADESLIKSRNWREMGKTPAIKEMTIQVPDPDVPNFSYYKFTAGIDDAVANRVGRPTWGDERARSWVEEAYPESYHDTGEAFESAGGVQRGPKGEISAFAHDPMKTQGPHIDNFNEPWMGDPDHPKMKRYAADLAKIPENQAAGVKAEEVIKDTSEIRSNLDRREAFETERRVPIKPDLWTDPADGQTHLVNGAVLKLLPSKEFGGGLQKHHLRQHLRAAVVDDIGTPSLMETDQALNYYREPGGLRSSVIEEADRINPGSGADAGEAADRLLAAVVGNTEQVGYNVTKALQNPSSLQRAARAGLKTSGDSAVARTWFKSLFQPYLEAPAAAPGGFLNRLSYYPKTLGLQGRYLAASGLRAAEDWLRIPGGRNLASKIASTESEQMASHGIATDFMDAFTAGWKNLEGDLGATLHPGPSKGLGRAVDVVGKAGQKGAEKLGVLNVVSNKINNFIAGMHDWTTAKLGENMAKDYLDLAHEGKLNLQQLQRLERIGANPESIVELTKIDQAAKAGQKTPFDPLFAKEFGNELGRAVPWDTQFRLSTPSRKQRFLSDKWLKDLFKFQTYNMGTLRHFEEFGNELKSAKSGADRMDALGRFAFRVGGAQLQGEVTRKLNDMLGKDRTALEDDSLAGRVAMNLLYSSTLGPLWLAFDYSAQKLGYQRPWAKRGSKEERAQGPENMIFNSQPVGTFLELAGVAPFGAMESVGLLEKKPGRQEESLLDPLKRAALRQPMIGDAARVVMGNEAVKEQMSVKKAGGSKSTTYDRLYGKKPSGGSSYDRLYGKPAKKTARERLYGK